MQLIFLAVMELGYNTTSVFSVLLLTSMVDRMTDKPPQGVLVEPILGQEVPFFVYLASVKLLNEHLNQEGNEEYHPLSDMDHLSDNSSPFKYRGPASLSGNTTHRTGLRIERELKRVNEAYSQIAGDRIWNERVISLALVFLKFHVPESALDKGVVINPRLSEAIKKESKLENSSDLGCTSPQNLFSENDQS